MGKLELPDKKGLSLICLAPVTDEVKTRWVVAMEENGTYWRDQRRHLTILPPGIYHVTREYYGKGIYRYYFCDLETGDQISWPWTTYEHFIAPSANVLWDHKSNWLPKVRRKE